MAPERTDSEKLRTPRWPAGSYLERMIKSRQQGETSRPNYFSEEFLKDHMNLIN